MAPDQWNQTAPESYKVRLDTTSGPITLAVTRAWSPLGADRFYNMVQSGYLADIAWFRVVPDFVAQGGMHGNPEVNKVWSEATIDDDEVLKSNTRGMVSFATSGKNSRSNQFFINFKENKNLDGMGFSPFAEVVDGMQNVDAIYSAHGESPNQGKVGAQGDAYLCGEFPNLDRIKSASIVD
jgi:peptidyl-prolyl cis-trans isomerase A (cyclophilin A)